jgi:hypothetical protein
MSFLKGFSAIDEPVQPSGLELAGQALAGRRQHFGEHPKRDMLAPLELFANPSCKDRHGELSDDLVDLADVDQQSCLGRDGSDQFDGQFEVDGQPVAGRLGSVRIAPPAVLVEERIDRESHTSAQTNHRGSWTSDCRHRTTSHSSEAALPQYLKHEIRNSKSETNPKYKAQMTETKIPLG